MTHPVKRVYVASYTERDTGAAKNNLDSKSHEYLIKYIGVYIE